MSKIPVAFIIGTNLSTIANQAKLDLGWKRIDLKRWEDLEGREVRYVRDKIDLLGFPDGSLVYLIDGYDERSDWYELDDMLTTRKFERRYL